MTKAKVEHVDKPKRKTKTELLNEKLAELKERKKELTESEHYKKQLADTTRIINDLDKRHVVASTELVKACNHAARELRFVVGHAVLKTDLVRNVNFVDDGLTPIVNDVMAYDRHNRHDIVWHPELIAALEALVGMKMVDFGKVGDTLSWSSRGMTFEEVLWKKMDEAVSRHSDVITVKTKVRVIEAERSVHAKTLYQLKCPLEGIEHEIYRVEHDISLAEQRAANLEGAVRGGKPVVDQQFTKARKRLQEVFNCVTPFVWPQQQ